MPTPTNKHMAALLTFVGLLPLVYFLPNMIMGYITSERMFVTLLSVALIVPIISYLWLPLAFSVLSKVSRSK